MQIHQVHSFKPLLAAARPCAASGSARPAPDTVELSASAGPDKPRQVPASVLQEVRKVFVPPDGYSSSGRSTTEDVSLDTGYQVSHRSGGGGCFGPSEHYWMLKGPDQSEPEQIAIGADVLASTGSCSVNSDGTFVVGRFTLSDTRKSERREADFQELKDKGLIESGADRPWGMDYLVDVPLKKGFFGAVPAAMRRRGWLPQKVLMALPPDAGVFDVGPDKSVAIAQNDRVLRYTKKGGLEVYAQLSKKVQDLEYLSDGSLAVMTEGAIGSDIYVFPNGKKEDPYFVPFSQGFPERYERGLRAKVESLKFLGGATLPELEKFLEKSDWIAASDRWRPWHANSSVDGNSSSAVVLWKETGPELWSYDRAQGEARPVGPLTMPQSERLAAPERDQFRPELTDDGKYMLARSRPEKQGGPVDLAVWDMAGGQPELIPGVRDVKLDVAKNEVSMVIITGEQRTVDLGRVGELKNESWYRQARLADLLDSDAEPKPERQIGEDAQKIIVGGVHVRKKD